MAELKHLSRPRKRYYSLSSGERTGKSLNLCGVSRRGVTDHHKPSYKSTVRPKVLERPAIEGDSPVIENPRLGWYPE